MSKLKSCKIIKVSFATDPNADFGLGVTLINDKGDSLEVMLTREEVIDLSLDLVVNAEAAEEFVRQLNNLSKLATGLAHRTASTSHQKPDERLES